MMNEAKNNPPGHLEKKEKKKQNAAPGYMSDYLKVSPTVEKERVYRLVRSLLPI